MPSRGEVLCDDQFRFSDGTTGKKLFVVLNNAKSGEPCLVVKATSQSKRYPKVKTGCNSEKRVFYVPVAEKVFVEDTYIQLDEIFPYSSVDLLSGLLHKRIRAICSLPDLMLRQLKNCLKKLRDDISEAHYKLIFRD